MLHINSLIIIFPLISAQNYIPQNKFAEAIPYSIYSIEKPKLKNTIEYNTINMDELIRNNNNQICK